MYESQLIPTALLFSNRPVLWVLHWTTGTVSGGNSAVADADVNTVNLFSKFCVTLVRPAHLSPPEVFQ